MSWIKSLSLCKMQNISLSTIVSRKDLHCWWYKCKKGIEKRTGTIEGEVVKYNNYSCPLPKFSTTLSKPVLFVLSSKRTLFFHMSSTHDRNKDVFSLKKSTSTNFWNLISYRSIILYQWLVVIIRFVLNLKYKFPLTIWFITCIAYSGNYVSY